jgi:hypothetical protein
MITRGSSVDFDTKR